MDEILEMGKQILASQPFSLLLGAQLTAFSPGVAELALPITSQLKQQHGFVHGGVISYLADNALTFAGGTALGPEILTAEYKINYLKPAVGTDLIARATVLNASKYQAVCHCEIFTVAEGREQLCAVAQGTIVRTGRSSEDQA